MTKVSTWTLRIARGFKNAQEKLCETWWLDLLKSGRLQSRLRFHGGKILTLHCQIELAKISDYCCTFFRLLEFMELTALHVPTSHRFNYLR